ncbi:methyltransferase domain-containing protein [Aliikangiella sp. IMCC44359]|uniref:methyltransferase domain-containing protein n=1 Tax=Aliikangiella sp. IMCC44359 TaxID=3459125 RepID=UPI00403A8172
MTNSSVLQKIKNMHTKYNTGNFNEAKKLANKILKKEPDNIHAQNILSRIYLSNNQLDKAETLLSILLEKHPSSAEINYTQALLYLKKNQHAFAIPLLENVISQDSANIEAIAQLANSYRQTGHYQKAIPLYNVLINAQYKGNIKINLFDCLRSTLPKRYTTNQENDMLCYLSFNEVNHNDLSSYVSTLLKQKYDLVEGKKEIEFDQIAQDQLLKTALHKITLSDEYLEMFLTGIRRALLNEMMNSSNIKIEYIDLVISIAAQQFINEYTYIEDQEEEASIYQLIIFLNTLLENNECHIDSLLAPVILIAMYRPLYSLEAAKKISQISIETWPEIVRPLIRQNIIEPHKEDMLGQSIAHLASIQNNISIEVKQQYEDNPYPKWQTASYVKSNTYIRDMQYVLSQYTPPKQLDKNNINILVAGCGTGKQVIELAKTYPKSKILAVDLSIKSLAYAKRKAEEYQISNVEFLNADILDLPQIKRQFDVIECIGVLHHMASPLDGWQILKDLLLPHGVMKIGLYSKLARQPIIEAKKIIQIKNLETTTKNIKLFRKHAMLGEYGENIKSLACHSLDFYSVSGCRDLFFHTQEHHFTCNKIAQSLAELNLEFLGFAMLPPEIVTSYLSKTPDHTNKRDLSVWAEAEKENPKAFSRMYHFWCQLKTDV